MSIGVFKSLDDLMSKIMHAMHISFIDMQNDTTLISAEKFEWYPVVNKFWFFVENNSYWHMLWKNSKKYQI